ncbi:hypothetical protein EW093_09025 [Thiospirochaeta perfilievii]|uniref:FxsA family protein n=1 Tax=Thiospirochaeta perfilievii TaxID=252967 RepID=A0A5C1QCZ8_9SPIO|nr:FxsA family protein [Thiospirochaeta perfilievii]QEN04839.1 hypothetical protein EW093_09025 [Thiospirochaeta perfilievii]
MFSTEFLLKLLNREKISKYIYTILFLSLTTVFDFIALFFFGGMFGNILYLAFICLLSLFGVIITIKLIGKQIIFMEKKHAVGTFPEGEFYHITTLFFAAIFIIFPGIISSTLGFFIICIPHLRLFIGRKISKGLKLDWHGVYEYKEIYNN